MARGRLFQTGATRCIKKVHYIRAAFVSSVAALSDVFSQFSPHAAFKQLQIKAYLPLNRVAVQLN